MAYYTREQYLLADCERKFYERFSEGLYPYVADTYIPQEIFDWITEYFTPKERIICKPEKASPIENRVVPKSLDLVNILKTITEKYSKTKERVKRMQEIAILAKTDKEEADKRLKEFDSEPRVINYEDEISWIADYYNRYKKSFSIQKRK